MPPESRKWILGSAVVGFTAAVIWLGAPVLPALLGAAVAGLLLYLQKRDPE